MSEFWRRLLDIDHIPADVSASALELGWAHPIPGWAWGLIIFIGGLFVMWTYIGLEGSRLARGALTTIRGLVLLAVLIIIAGPTLVYPREHVEQDRVLMLIDRSESMNVADESPGGDAGVRATREARLRQTLKESQDGFAYVAGEHDLAWFGFDAGAFPLSDSEPDDAADGGSGGTSASPLPLPALGAADGSQTALGPAISQVLRYAAARPVSAIIVFSDGRTTQPPGRDVLRRLQADAIEVFVVPYGSASPLGDYAIDSIEVPQRAFLRDKIPVRVRLDQGGGESAAGQNGATLALVDERSGEILDQARLEAGDDVDALTLNATSDEAGLARWTVRIEPDVPDLVAENNTQSFEIDLIDRPIRVLYIDGLPRWDYRFLKSTAIREASIEASAMLVSADRDFAQEGNTPITRLPNSPEEFDPYDVIVIGDVHAEFFSPRQLEMIRDHVAERGAGLLWAVGPRANPMSYAGTALEPLLPMRAATIALVSTIGVPVSIEPTIAASSLGILQLVDQDGTSAWRTLSDPAVSWAQFKWALRLDTQDLKPAVQVLAETIEPIRAGGTPLPIVTHLRYGSGQSIFVGTDELWRWRFGRGETLPEQFWIQIVRMLGRDRLAATGRGATLEASPRRTQIGQPVVIDVRVTNADLAEADLGGLLIHIVDPELGRVAEIPLVPVEGAPGRYTAAWIADRPGQFEIEATDPPLSQFQLTDRITVFQPDDEMQRPEADHDLLARLAQQTGGGVIMPDQVGTILRQDILRKREIRTQLDIVEDLWDTPLAFALILVLLTFEWIGRRLIRLV